MSRGEDFILDSIVPAFRFGCVNPGLYRGAYPTLRNFRHLNRLGLKTIVSLIPEQPVSDLKSFCAFAKIQLVSISIQRATLLNSSLSNNLLSALQIITDAKTHSTVYIHCLDGRRITGLLILMIRRLQGWCPSSAFVEYWTYQTAMRAPLNAFEIEKSTKDIAKFVLESLSNFKLSSTFPDYPSWIDTKRIFMSSPSNDLTSNCSTLAPSSPTAHSQSMKGYSSAGGHNRNRSNFHWRRRPESAGIIDSVDDDDDERSFMHGHPYGNYNLTSPVHDDHMFAMKKRTTSSLECYYDTADLYLAALAEAGTDLVSKGSLELIESPCLLMGQHDNDMEKKRRHRSCRQPKPVDLQLSRTLSSLCLHGLDVPASSRLAGVPLPAPTVLPSVGRGQSNLNKQQENDAHHCAAETAAGHRSTPAK